MLFVGRKTTVQLELATPLDLCCNCGEGGPVELIETPLRETRFFLFFGTELELRETFPYCERCRGSAKRVRLRWPSKLLVAGLATSATFLILVFTPSTPQVIQSNLFISAAVIGSSLSFVHFWLRQWRNPQRSYYQPVSLVSAVIDAGRLQRLALAFSNHRYAQTFARANADLVSAKVLTIRSDPSHVRAT